MFVIPMLGKSSRFFQAGYEVPKYELPIGSTDLLSMSISSFKPYFQTDRFIFMVRSDADLDYLNDKIQSLQIKDYVIKQHYGDTRGQAESVQIAIESEDEGEELYIFNIDTILFRFEKLISGQQFDGYLEVFKGEGNHWSFVLPDEADASLAQCVVEKNRVSDLCSNGLYYFKTSRIFLDALRQYKAERLDRDQELYIAPLYSVLIDSGFTIRYKLVDKSDVGFCGTPEEYENFLSSQC